MEHRALALNPKMQLFSSKPAIAIVREHRLQNVLRGFSDLQRSVPWSLYEVRRIRHPKKNDPTRQGWVWRSATPLDTGSRAAMRRELARTAAKAGATVDVDEFGISRATLITPGTDYPAPEHLYAVGPEGAIDKARDTFEERWNALVGRRSPRIRSSDVAA